jgi:hypothetical protein
MSLRSSLRYMYRGPGAILVVILLGLGICWIIKSGQDKERAAAEARQKQRELGQVNPQDSIDASQAAKERLLSDRKLHPGNRSGPEATPTPLAPAVQTTQQQRALPQLVSFYAQVQATPIPSPTPAPERPRETQIWLPRGVFIPCALVGTVESSHINTPVVGEVICDVCQNGHLIIPAGAIVTSFAQAGAVRDRIEVAGKWSITYPDGREFEIQGIACDREADPSNQQFGIEDCTAGLQGELIESDHWANAKAFIALLLTATTQAGTAAVSGALQSGHGGGVGVGLPDTTPILAKYLDQLLNGETGDGRFVRVRASKEFYIFPVDVVFPTHRSIGAKRQEAESHPPEAAPTNPVDSALQLEREALRAAQAQSSPTPEPRINYENNHPR